MKIKKIIALIIAVLMLASVFAACSKDDGNSEGGKDIKGNYVADYVPVKDYEGAKFRALTLSTESCGLYTSFVTEADDTDRVNAAIYKRNSIIETRFNVEFVENLSENYMTLTDEFVESTGANSDDYDINLLIQRDAYKWGTQGYIVRTGSLPYNDPTQDWYVHDVNDMLTVDGISFLSYTDECINMLGQTNCVLFNARTFEDNNMTSPYDKIEDKTWTLDYFYETARSVTNDLNNDFYYDEYDELGIVSESDMFDPTLWIGADTYTIVKDSDDYPNYTADKNEKLIGILETMADLYDEEKVYYDTYTRPTELYASRGDYRSQAHAMFEGGNVLYCVTIIETLRTLTEMADDFGIVPAPLYDEGQDSYHSRVIDGWIFVVPVSNTNLEMTSAILESLAVESKNYVVDAYYRESLQDRYTRGDPRAIKMLDLISSTRTIDLGDTIWQADVRYKIRDAIRSGQGNISSTLSGRAAYMKITIEKYLKDLEEVLEEEA